MNDYEYEYLCQDMMWQKGFLLKLLVKDNISSRGLIKIMQRKSF